MNNLIKGTRVPSKQKQKNTSGVFCDSNGQLTTWNLTWMQMDFFFRAAVPDMNVLLMLPTRRSDVDPSMPAMEPLTMPPTVPLMLPNSWLRAGLQRTEWEKICMWCWWPPCHFFGSNQAKEDVKVTRHVNGSIRKYCGNVSVVILSGCVGIKCQSDMQ